ncbi:MAG TPA: response regulator transcription factor [Gemmatimonadales bacterium]|jgi:two-component system copper resistance phosphate regulon response regulator CusR
MRVLLVEDDAKLANLVATGLREQQIEVVVEGTFAAGRSRAILGSYDVLILDVLLPDGSGFDLCRQLRGKEIGTPILMLTARDTITDRVTGLTAGADDYLTKPFAFLELVARVRALARRRPALVPRVVRVADLMVNLESRRVTRNRVPIRLTAREFALLEIFALRADAVLSRAEISAHVWDDNHDPFSNLVDVLIGRLRRKIDDGHDVRLIHTVRGAGYRLGI